jgi:transposase
MDSNKGSTQVERLAVVDTGRRRRWTDDEKLKIVLESLQAPRAISSTRTAAWDISVVAADLEAVV